MNAENVRRTFEDDRAASVIYGTTGDPTPVLSFMHAQFFLLDDVIFNVRSLFDYVAGLVGVMRLGKRRLWKALVDECARPSPPLLQPLAQMIVAADEQWLAALDQCRDDLIHIEAQFGKGEWSLNYKSLVAAWRIWIRDELRNKLAGVFGSDREAIGVEDAGGAIACRAFESAAAIVRATWETCPYADPPWVKKPRTLPP
jgi:hypothetical protein